MSDGIVEFGIEFTGLEQAFKRVEQRLAGKDLSVDIDLDVSRFNRQLNDIGNSSSSVLEGIFQGIGQSIANTLINAVGGALRTIGGLVQGSVRDFATLEQSVVQFAGRARASVDSVEELEQLTAQAADTFRDIGAATSKTPEDVASIATRMIELGGAADQTLSSVEDVVAALEATGFTDIDATAQAFQIASTIFGTSSEELADKFALLANTTAVTSAADLLQVFSKAGGAAQDLEVSADELLTIFASFRDAGATAEVAATATRNAIQKLALAGKDPKALEALEQLNVSFFDAENNARPVLDVLADLDRALAGSSDQFRAETLADIFDPRSASQLSGILGQLDGRVESTFNNLTNNAEGFASASQDALNQGPIAALVRLQSALNVLSGLFGSAFAAGSESIIRGFTEVVQFINDQDGIFDGLRAGSEALANAFANIDLGGTLAPALTEILELISNGIGGALQNLAGFFENNAEAVQGFINRLVLGTEAGLALADTLRQGVGLFVQFTEATGGFDRAIAIFEGFTNTVIAFNRDGFAGLIDQFKAFDDGLQNSESFVGQIFATLTGSIRVSINLYEKLGDAFRAAFDNPVAEGFFSLLQRILGVVGQVGGVIRDTWLAPLNFALNALGNINALLEGLQTTTSDIGANLSENLSGAFDGFADGATSALAEAAAEQNAITEEANATDVANTAETEAEKTKIRQEALDQLERDTTNALNAIDQSVNSQIQGVLQLQLDGGISDSDAESQIADIQARASQDRIAAKQDEINQIQALEQQGILSAEDAADQLSGLQVELGDLVNSRLEQEIAAQERAKQAALDKIDSELNAAQQLQQARSIEFDIANEALSQQSNLLSAQLGLAQSLNQLEQNRLQNALQVAEAAGDEATAAQVRERIAESQLQATQQEFSAKQQQLDLSIQQNQIEAQRHIATAEIAALEADIAVQKAQINNVSAEELSVLQRISQLRAEQVDQARDDAAIQNQINSIEQERLSVEQQIALEQLAQQDNARGLQRTNETLIQQAEELRGLEQDRASSVVGALGRGSVNFDSSDALDQLSQIQDRFRTAQRGGLFQGANSDFSQAFSQVQSALRGGGSDQQLLRIAQSDNDFVGEILNQIGRSDITNLVAADQQFNQINEQLAAANVPVVEELQSLREEIAAALAEPRVVNLTANTPDSAADVGKMLMETALATRRRTGL